MYFRIAFYFYCPKWCVCVCVLCMHTRKHLRTRVSELAYAVDMSADVSLDVYTLYMHAECNNITGQ